MTALTLSPPRSKRYRTIPLDDVPDPLHSALVEILADPRAAIEAETFLLVYGPEGSGKTGAVGVLHRELAELGWLVHWLNAIEFPENWETTDDNDSASDLVNICSRCKILIIDDLGKEPEKAMKYMRKILEAWAKKEGGIIIATCNLNIDEDDKNQCELAQRYGFAYRSRILGDGEMILYDGPDRRLQDNK